MFLEEILLFLFFLQFLIDLRITETRKLLKLLKPCFSFIHDSLVLLFSNKLFTFIVEYGEILGFIHNHHFSI
jgi:hypothetical protein